MLRTSAFLASMLTMLPGIAQVSNPVQPAPEMKQFGIFTGSWTGTSSKNGATAERAAGTFRIMHGGHWMRADLNLGRDLDATLMVGWDAVGKSFSAHLFESGRPNPIIGKATFNRDTLVIESQSGATGGLRWTLQIDSGKANELRILRESRTSSGWIQDGVTALRKPERGEGGGMTLPRL